MARNPYEQVHIDAQRDTARKRAEYNNREYYLQDAPCNFLDEVPLTVDGGVHHGKAHAWFMQMFAHDTASRPTEITALHNLLHTALSRYQTVQPAPLIIVPRLTRADIQRPCAVCDDITPDGTKELCVDCHEQYRIDIRYDALVSSQFVLERMIREANVVHRDVLKQVLRAA